MLCDSPPLVAVVILNWNGLADTLECLRSVSALAWDRLDVIVVDNGSTDESVAAIRRQFPSVELIETGQNLGYAEGNNVGIRRAVAGGADFALILNNDTTCDSQLVARLVEAAESFPDGGFFCPRMFYMHEPQKVWFDGAVWDSARLTFNFPGQDEPGVNLSEQIHETAYACGAALFVRTSLVEQVGTFDASYFLVWEESDWCYRARAEGWKSYVVPAAQIWHRVGASFGTEDAPLRTYFSSRNRLFWLSRHGTATERLRALRHGLAVLIPSFYWSGTGGNNLLRGLWWSLAEWARSFTGGGRSFQFLAKRRAILDYLLGRVGPPPACILQFNRQWIAERKAGQSRGG